VTRLLPGLADIPFILSNLQMNPISSWHIACKFDCLSLFMVASSTLMTGFDGTASGISIPSMKT
jgi:hypothetical protein